MKTRALWILLVTGAAWGAPAPGKPPNQPAIAAATAALIPDPGWLISYVDDDDLVVARVTKTGLKELLHVPHDSSYTMWLDPKTLVQVNVDYDKNVDVKWIVDGVIDAKRTVKHRAAIWGRKSDAELVSLEGVGRTPDGGIWLVRCLEQETAECQKRSWMRVDLAKPAAANKKPKRLVSVGEEVKAPTIEAPPGFSARLVKITSKVTPKRKLAAIECAGPKGKLVWSQESPPIDPAESFTPKRVRWIQATPALLEVEGTFTNPVGQRSTEQFVFRDCGAEPYEQVAWIGDRAWSYKLRGDDEANIHVMVDDQPVATIAAGWLLAAPR